eukprot:g1953.t1
MLSFEWILAATLAEDAGHVFASFLPSALDPERCLEVLQPQRLVKAALSVLLLATRAATARRTLTHAFALAAKLRQLPATDSERRGHSQSMAAVATRLATELSSCEEFVEPGESARWSKLVWSKCVL